MHQKKRTFLLLQMLLVITVMTACSSGLENMPVQSGQLEEEQEVLGKQTGKNAAVVTLNDQTFLYKDLEFYMLMNKVQIELQHAEDIKGLQGEEAVERTIYWNEQREYYENINVNLESLIEINSLLLFAEGKGYTVTKENLTKAVEEFKEKTANNNVAKRMIKEYGEAEYDERISEYIRQTLLYTRVEKEIEEQLAAENPDRSEQEINDLLNAEIEELSKGNHSTIDIHIK